jgi:hypothetical protein
MAAACRSGIGIRLRAKRYGGTSPELAATRSTTRRSTRASNASGKWNTTFQVYRAYEQAEARLVERGAHIERVALDYELK